MSKAKKRFYEHVGVQHQEDVWCVQLDGKTVHTPRGNRLHLPNAELAHAIAAEWDAQLDTIDTATMHLTTLACTALDGVEGKESAVIAALLPFAQTDQICFREDKHEAFRAKQASLLDVWVAWAQEALGATLMVTEGIMPVLQPEKNEDIFQEALENLNVYELTATAYLIEQLRSMVLALAVQRQALTGMEAFRLSTLEEFFQIEEWGIDEELQNRLDRTQAEVLAAEQFLSLLHPAD